MILFAFYFPVSGSRSVISAVYQLILIIIVIIITCLGTNLPAFHTFLETSNILIRKTDDNKKYDNDIYCTIHIMYIPILSYTIIE